MKKRTYTDEFKTHALVEVRLNGGNVKDTARRLNIPQPTLCEWTLREKLISNTIPSRIKERVANGWAGVADLAIQRLTELMPTAQNVRDVAYAGGIATTAYLDLTLGRKGTEVTVNNIVPVQVVIQDQSNI